VAPASGAARSEGSGLIPDRPHAANQWPVFSASAGQELVALRVAITSTTCGRSIMTSRLSRTSNRSESRSQSITWIESSCGEAINRVERWSFLRGLGVDQAKCPARRYLYVPVAALEGAAGKVLCRDEFRGDAA
jgi:hypothetical protein